jgi:hypothetical protein
MGEVLIAIAMLCQVHGAVNAYQAIEIQQRCAKQLLVCIDNNPKHYYYNSLAYCLMRDKK